MNALEKTSVASVADPRVIPGSFVYQHPTISPLASYVSSLTEGSKITNDAEANSRKIELMNSMVRKYSAEFRQHAPSKQSDGEVVLVTGTTGWLGSFILAELLESDVKRVYVVNRKGPSLPSDAAVGCIQRTEPRWRSSSVGEAHFARG